MSNAEFARRITLGFKLLSGYHVGKLSRDDIDKLGARDDVPWNSTNLEAEINRIADILAGDNFFRYWGSWRSPLIALTSDAVALNFLLLTVRDWERKDRPTNPGAAQYRAFVRNSRILMDRSVYEYATKQWRGAGDSRIADNLERLGGAGPSFDVVPAHDWTILVDDVIDQGRIAGRSYLKNVDKSIRLLLLYSYVAAEISGPSELDGPFDVDHIIPESLFDAEAVGGQRDQKNHIVNLGLLPRKPNISKSNNPLTSVTDSWLKDQVLRYEFVSEVDYPQLSNIGGLPRLRELRAQRLKTALTTRRETAIG